MKFYFSNSLPHLEVVAAILSLVCFLLAFIRPFLGYAFFERVESQFRALGNRPILAGLILAGLPVGLRLALLPVYGIPGPFMLDEFAYLLQADTYASGRLTNPPHPLWRHFESIYVLSQPTYNGQYPVAQSLALAVGQVLTHQPWAGVVLSMALLCPLMYWMLLAWVPPGWALAGGLLTICQWGVLSYWMNSYWGATVPAIGGVLILGALPRLRNKPTIRTALVLALGLVILLNSRPLEAVLFLLVVSVTLLLWFLASQELSFSAWSGRIAVPIALVLALTFTFMAYYNFRVTGHATELPYTLHRRLYGSPQAFLFQNPYIVHTSMPRDVRAEYEDQLNKHARRNSLGGLVRATAAKIRIFWTFYIGTALTLPLAFVPFIWRQRNMGIILALAALFAVYILTFHAFFPQYAAPMLGGIMIILLNCIRVMRAAGPAGLFLSRSLPCVCLILLVIPALGRLVEPVLPKPLAFTKGLWKDDFYPDFPRAKFERFLQSQPGPQLVIVRYEYPQHFVGDEWVYNRADIDHSKIVWARELDPESNRRLLEYFENRAVWIGKPDEVPPRLEGPIQRRELATRGH